MLTLGACEPTIEPIPPQDQRVLVHAILDLGAAEQIVRVERTRGALRQDVEGAEVTITTPEGRSFRAVEDMPSPPDPSDPFAPIPRRGDYRVRLADEGVSLLPGGIYRLDIRTPAGEVVSGTTTVPNAEPATDDPAESQGFAGQTDTLRLSWPRVAGARSYQVTARALSEFSEPYSVFADTSVVIAGTARSIEDSPAFPRGFRVKVVVTAVDDNYYTYYRQAVDPFAGAPPSRLTGAIGVFGAIVPVLVRRYDVR